MTKEEEVAQIKDDLHKLRTARRHILSVEEKLSDRLVDLIGYCGGWCGGIKCKSCESRP